MGGKIMYLYEGVKAIPRPSDELNLILYVKVKTMNSPVKSIN